MTTGDKALAIYKAALDAVHPRQFMKHYLHADAGNVRIGNRQFAREGLGRLVVIAVGKAAAGMALEAERLLNDAITYGICITKHGHALALQHIVVHEAGHPAPDAESVQAAKLVQQMVEDAEANDVILVLLSGGASSLIADLPAGCTLQDWQVLNNLLVNSGAAIAEINTVRKHLGFLKGGKLAMLAKPATVITLAISDVVNDDIHVIGSGLTVPTQTSVHDVLQILQHYHLWPHVPGSVKSSLLHQKDEYNRQPATAIAAPGTGTYYLVANNLIAVHAAQSAAKTFFKNAVIFKKGMTGDAEKNARLLVQQLKDFRGEKPACFILGGEPTVALTTPGKGGRCQHFALAALDEMMRFGGADSSHQLTVLAAGTDGTDGPTDAAGAIVDNNCLLKANSLQLQHSRYLAAFDSYHFFEATGSLVKIAPSQTNVCDIVIVIVE